MLSSYFVFLHQTTTNAVNKPKLCNCLISSFYFKPQLFSYNLAHLHIVLYRLSTSNHNVEQVIIQGFTIVLYRLSTSNHNSAPSFPCRASIVLYRLSTSNHNPGDRWEGRLSIVLYRLSTSNHNWPFTEYHIKKIVLYRLSTSNHNCHPRCPHSRTIVLYRLSTSNHNWDFLCFQFAGIVLYRLSTSNHNSKTARCIAICIVLYRLSTSNHNRKFRFRANHHHCLISSFYIKPQLYTGCSFEFYPLSYIVFLHQTTTMAQLMAAILRLSYIVFLHQTTTKGWHIPQPLHIVLYRLSTSNHNLTYMLPNVM